MATPFNYFFFTIFTLNIFLGFHVYAVPYDYSYKPECVAKPEAPLYNGGIAANPEFNEELKGWKAAGNAKLEIAKSPDGNNYAVVSNLMLELSDGISQPFNVEREKLYAVSAWIQVVAEGEIKVQANIKTSTGNVTAGSILAKPGCWSMFKGGFVVNVTESAHLNFEVHGKNMEFWVDSISLQPFTQEEWTSHIDESVEKVRKTKVKFTAVDQNGKPLANAGVAIKQLKPNFPFGCILTGRIINNPPFQKWFLERFNYAAFENELKWAFNEDPQGVENYTIPDAMLEFAKSNGLPVRGHNILWDDPKYMLPWMKALSDEELHKAAEKRIKSVVSRYKGQFTHWDVVNENLHYNKLSNLFPGKSSDVFKLAHQIDPHPILFLNEYNVIEDNYIFGMAITMNFIAKVNEIRSGGYDGPLGLGLESHFDYIDPNLPSIRASLDMLSATGLPIWITEFTVADKMPNQLKSASALLRELHSYPTVEGILIWSAVYDNGQCFTMCLTDQDYKNKPVGDLVDKFMYEYIRVDSNGTTDSNGVFEASLVHGEYEANVTLPNGAQSPASQTFNLVPNGNVTAVELKINV